MNQKEWEDKFVEVLVAKGVPSILAKLSARIVSPYKSEESPEKAAEIEYARLYR